MNKRIRGIVAGLAITTAAITGTTLATHAAAPRRDTTWGAPDTTSDTTWGVPPVVGTVDNAVSTVITPLDTTWG